MTLEVQLSDRTYQFLAEQARARGLDSPAEYLAALATEAEADRDAVEDALVKGLQSDPPREMSRGDLGSLKRRVWQRDNLQIDDQERLARECAKLNRQEEQESADRGLDEDLNSWPEY